MGLCLSVYLLYESVEAKGELRSRPAAAASSRLKFLRMRRVGAFVCCFSLSISFKFVHQKLLSSFFLEFIFFRFCRDFFNEND